MVDTPSTAAPALNKIGALLSQNTSNTSFIKVCENDGADDPVHDEGYDAIASHQTSIFLVQSRLGQEEGRTTMVDNVSMAAPAQVTIGTKHNQNNTDAPSKKNSDKE